MLERPIQPNKVDQRVVRCKDCGQLLEEDTSLPVENQAPCPKCGSKKRFVDMTCQETISLHEKLSLKARHGKGGKPFMEQVVGDDLHRKTGKWMIIQRVIDRIKNWYSEIIRDPKTGEIVHHTEEPLTEHRGHGDAKKSKK